MSDALAFALKKFLKNRGADLEHYLSAFPTQLNLRTEIVKGTTGGATGKAEYIGMALPDVTLTQAKWQIKKLIYDSTGFQTKVVFAEQNCDFDKIFDSGSSEYASYNYVTT